MRHFKLFSDQLFLKCLFLKVRSTTSSPTARVATSLAWSCRLCRTSSTSSGTFGPEQSFASFSSACVLLFRLILILTMSGTKTTQENVISFVFFEYFENAVILFSNCVLIHFQNLLGAIYTYIYPSHALSMMVHKIGNTVRFNIKKID